MSRNLVELTCTSVIWVDLVFVLALKTIHDVWILRIGVLENVYLLLDFLLKSGLVEMTSLNVHRSSFHIDSIDV